MTLRQHLSSDQRVDPASTKVSQRLLKDFAACSRVAIDASDSQCREKQLQHFLELFGALADVVNVFLPATGTRSRHCFAVVAVVTHNHAFAAMISQRHIAIWTLNCFTARAAKNEA